MDFSFSVCPFWGERFAGFDDECRLCGIAASPFCLDGKEHGVLQQWPFDSLDGCSGSSNLAVGARAEEGSGGIFATGIVSSLA